MTLGMSKPWQKREVAERLIKAAGDLLDELADDPDIHDLDAQAWIAGWLKNLPSAAWDERLGPRPSKRQGDDK